MEPAQKGFAEKLPDFFRVFAVSPSFPRRRESIGMAGASPSRPRHSQLKGEGGAKTRVQLPFMSHFVSTQQPRYTSS